MFVPTSECRHYVVSDGIGLSARLAIDDVVVIDRDLDRHDSDDHSWCYAANKPPS